MDAFGAPFVFCHFGPPLHSLLGAFGPVVDKLTKVEQEVMHDRPILRITLKRRLAVTVFVTDLRGDAEKRCLNVLPNLRQDGGKILVGPKRRQHATQHGFKLKERTFAQWCGKPLLEGLSPPLA